MLSVMVVIPRAPLKPCLLLNVNVVIPAVASTELTSLPSLVFLRKLSMVFLVRLFFLSFVTTEPTGALLA